MGLPDKPAGSVVQTGKHGVTTAIRGAGRRATIPSTSPIAATDILE
ncbi:hypothetical protein [Halocatena halophila]